VTSTTRHRAARFCNFRNPGATGLPPPVGSTLCHAGGRNMVPSHDFFMAGKKSPYSEPPMIEPSRIAPVDPSYPVAVERLGTMAHYPWLAVTGNDSLCSLVL